MPVIRDFLEGIRRVLKGFRSEMNYSSRLPLSCLDFTFFGCNFFFWGGGVEWMEDYAQISGLFLDTRVWRFIVEMGSRLLKNMFFQQNFA